ncbi:hypothetical protein M514_11334 [Trichuris suis]|uniref:Reverse transcriptase domain-containing protein n=1 Tax=Trichuris suis TaxID=68888 RepID=A0A085MRW9_9BILA|nr:hypothetical protein M514_11334 [Trichuris suis]
MMSKVEGARGQGTKFNPLAKISFPLVKKRTSTVKDSKTFVEEIRTFRTSPTDILVSYDLKDLFTSIPIPYTLNILHELLYTDSTLPGRTKLSPFQMVQLVSFCMLEGNFFHFQGRYFRQQGGAPMGSPLSPVLAEVFMERLEDHAFSKADHNILPHLFKRYVDDIFVIIESGREETFLNFLNALFPNIISFTIEKEVCGRLPFLDSLVMRTSEGLKTRVYRKQTHSDPYLHFSSHHPRAVMRAVIQGMTRRAVDLCEPEFLAMELHHIYQTFKTNGYPPRLIHAVIQQTLSNPRRQRTSTSNGPRILLPYYKGLSEKLQKLGRTLNFSVCYKRGPYLRSLFRGDKVKVPLNEQPGVVYGVRCSCSAASIGETGFTLSRRFSQHISHLRRYIRAEQELEDAGHSTTTTPPICRRGMAGVFEFLLGMNVSPKVADVL